MRVFLLLCRRELATHFTALSSYVTMAVVLAVTGAGFWLQVRLSRGEPFRQDIALFWLPTLWMMALIAATAATMKSFAEEKKAGTIETLMTAPVTDTEVVMGKYAASLIIFIVTFLPMAGYMFILRRVGSWTEPPDIGAMVSGFALFFLIGAFYISVGMLASVLNRSQVASALACFSVLCLLFVLVGVLGYVFEGRAAEVLGYISPFAHIKDFSRGQLDTGPVVFYLSGTATVLFAVVKALESRRWL